LEFKSSESIIETVLIGSDDFFISNKESSPSNVDAMIYFPLNAHEVTNELGTDDLYTIEAFFRLG
jgi:hypothetical protein